MTNDEQSADRLQDAEDLEYFRQRCHALEVAVTGARAVLAVADGQPIPHASVCERCGRPVSGQLRFCTRCHVDVDDFEAVDDRNRLAAGRVRALLNHLDREGTAEWDHVSALEQPLRQILADLTGGEQ